MDHHSTDCKLCKKLRHESLPLERVTILLALLAFLAGYPRMCSSAWMNVANIQLTKTLVANRGEDALWESIDRLSQIRAWDANNSRACRNLGYAYSILGEMKDAINVLETATNLAPADCLAWFWLGNLYQSVGDEVAAVRAWQRAGAAPFFVVEADALREQGEWAEARALYERATRVNPQLAAAWLGWGLTSSSDDQQTIPRLLRALSLDPSLLSAYSRLGDIYTGLGDYQEALRWYLEAYRVCQKCPGMGYAIARTYHSLGDPTSALTFMITAAEDSPSDVTIQYNLGVTYRAMGDLPNAIATYRRVLDLALEHQLRVRVYVELAELYATSGDVESAIQTYRAALELDPQNQVIRQRLEMLEQ